MNWFKRVAVSGVLIGSLLTGVHADAYYPCATWVTVSTTPKAYSTCHATYVGAWWWNIAGTGCFRWVSWRRTQQRVDYNGSHQRRNRTFLENEVYFRGAVQVGPIVVNKTGTVPGSHTTSTVSQSTTYGTWHCTGVGSGGGGGGSGGW